MTSFQDLGLPVPIVHELTAQGIIRPFPIQAATIPDALAGRDILGKGPTGSGKTFSFGLPMICRLSGTGSSHVGHPRGVVLAPTRELAMQIRQRLDDPARVMGLRVIEVIGGVNINKHKTALARPVDILIATPGRTADLIRQGDLCLDHVEITVLDEADQMADMGFIPQVRALMDQTPEVGQRMLFSATLDGDVRVLVDRYLTDPLTHSVTAEDDDAQRMAHYQLRVPDRDTYNEVIARIAGRDGKTIMFMRSRHRVDRQVKKLRRRGIAAQGLHGDKSQSARVRAIEGFANGTVPILVATDIAARGIDIGNVSLVVHLDPPAEHKAYVHRAGRTARAGSTGVVVTLVQPGQEDDVNALMKAAGITATVVSVDQDSPELRAITGARVVHGSPLPPPGQEPAHSSNGASMTTANRQGRRTSTNRQKPTHSRRRAQEIATPRNATSGRRRRSYRS